MNDDQREIFSKYLTIKIEKLVVNVSMALTESSNKTSIADLTGVKAFMC